MRKKYNWEDPVHKRLYRIWSGMKSRCSAKPGKEGYKNYASRGITVCDEWSKDFLAFYAWALNNGYSYDLTLDRIDNNKGYSSENCRWATQNQQHNNTRVNAKLTLNGETHTINEWSKKLGRPAGAIYRRKYMGWSDEDVLTVPYMGKREDKLVTVTPEVLKNVCEKSIACGFCLNKKDFIAKLGISYSNVFGMMAGRIKITKRNNDKILQFYNFLTERKK